MTQKKDETKCPICFIKVKRKHYSEHQIRYHGLINKYSKTLKKRRIQKRLKKLLTKNKIFSEDKYNDKVGKMAKIKKNLKISSKILKFNNQLSKKSMIEKDKASEKNKITFLEKEKDIIKTNIKIDGEKDSKKNLENEKEIEKPIINKFIIKKEIILFKNGINTKINVKEITDEINYTKISKTEISNENEKNNKWLVGVKISKNNEKKIVNYSEQNENKQKIDKEDRKMKKIESIMEKIDKLDDEDMLIF